MAATYSKPIKINRWADTGVIVEPSEVKKDSGWVAPELPPDTFFNWWQNLSGQWTKWFDERMADGASADQFVLKDPDNAATAIKLRDQSGGAAVEFIDDANFYIHKAAADQPRMNFDAAAFMQFDQTLNEWLLDIGGTRARLDSTGMRLVDSLVVGTNSLAPDTFKRLQLGNSTVPAKDGDAWFGWNVADANVARMVLSDANSVFIDNSSQNIRLFHGGGASLLGFAGTDDVKFFGDVGVDGGVALSAHPGVVPTAGYVKIDSDDFRLEGFGATAGGSIHWNFSNNDRLEFDAAANRLEFYFAGVRTLSMTSGLVSDENNNVDLGLVTGVTTGTYFKSVAAQEFVPANATAYSSLPGDPGNPPQRLRAQTIPFLICSMDAGGATPINLVHNVQSTVRTGTGSYTITPHRTSNWGIGNVFVGIRSNGSVITDGHGAMIGGTTVFTKTYLNGVLADMPHSVLVFDGGWIS